MSSTTTLPQAPPSDVNGLVWYALGLATIPGVYGLLYLGAAIADRIDNWAAVRVVTLKPEYRTKRFALGRPNRRFGVTVLVRIPWNHRRGIVFILGWGRTENEDHASG